MISGLAPESWVDANQQHLWRAVRRVRGAVEVWAGVEGSAGTDERRDAATPAEPLEPAALDVLCATFGLSPFERDVLVLCAAVELDGSFAELCARAQGDPRRCYATFGLALSALPEPHWSALTPARPLRRWRLVDLSSDDGLTSGRLRIDERVLHYLAGVQHLDERVTRIVRPVPVPPDAALAPSQHAQAHRLAAAWSSGDGTGGLPAVQLHAGDPDDASAIAATACASVGLGLVAVSAAALPVDPAELDAFARLCDREAALAGMALLVDCEELGYGADPARAVAVSRLVDSTAGAVIVLGRDGRRSWRRTTVIIDVAGPEGRERRALWLEAIGGASTALNGHLDAVVAQFALGAAGIRSAVADARSRSPLDDLGDELWDAARSRGRPYLDDLAQRIEASARWDDLVLPEPQREALRAISAQARHRGVVYEQWGFAARSARGLGISALFAGPSGTGKTMAAEVLANELRLDLYRIDLSSVVSKWIGETEKNLRRVFDAAESGAAVLFFDEADALFGKRSEVKDSHDRYANIEVSYLLQRMEAYRGLAILATNMKAALDPAFLRRIRFVVQFPFPGADQRAEIWRRAFPVETPTEGLDAGRLARLTVAGGSIRNMAVNAAFSAAAERQPVRMSHVLGAARAEYAKLEKPLPDAELGAPA